MDKQDRLHSQQVYNPNDPDIMQEQLQRLELLYDFNATRPSQLQLREQLLRKMFAEIGEDCYIEPPFHSNFSGKHVHFGNGVYANFNLTLVDDTHIYVGEHTMFAPNVIVVTPLTLSAPPLEKRLINSTCPYISAKIVG